MMPLGIFLAALESSAGGGGVTAWDPAALSAQALTNIPGGAAYNPLDNSVTVFGSFTDLNGNTVPRIVKINPDGTVDASWMANIVHNGSFIFGLDFDDNGDCYIAGDFTTWNGVACGGGRVGLNPDGSVKWRSTSGAPSNANIGGGVAVGSGDYVAMSGPSGLIYRVTKATGATFTMSAGSGINPASVARGKDGGFITLKLISGTTAQITTFTSGATVVGSNSSVTVATTGEEAHAWCKAAYEPSGDHVLIACGSGLRRYAHATCAFVDSVAGPGGTPVVTPQGIVVMDNTTKEYKRYDLSLTLDITSPAGAYGPTGLSRWTQASGEIYVPDPSQPFILTTGLFTDVGGVTRTRFAALKASDLTLI